MNLQKAYFDKKIHQYPQEKIISLDRSHQFEIDHIASLLNLIPPKNLLDLGSGNGRISIPFLKKGFNIHAVDISKKSLQALQLTYKKNKTPAWGQLTTSSSLPRNKKFDGVIGSDILHHVDLKETFPLIYEALKPGETMVISEPNAWHLPWYLYVFFLLSWDVEKGILHCSIPELKQILFNTGFDNIIIEGHGLLPTSIFNFSPFFARLNTLRLGNLPLVKFFAFRLMICARRPQ